MSAVGPGSADRRRRLLVTGGAGFIGSNFILHWLARHPADRVVNLDALTYAGNPENLAAVEQHPGYRFVHGDICDNALVRALLRDEQIDHLVHFAAESHVDRSISGPAAFVNTNVHGTFSLLEATRDAWGRGDAGQRFVHVSTDEVYGSLEPDEPAFTELSRYQPNSPYSASKAASDHLVRAWFHTFGLPVITTNCSNNYGPYQFPEKLIPLTILNALRGDPLPVYGDGMNVRDWLYVGDHCAALECVLTRGVPGETYNIGGGNQWPNLHIVQRICDRLDEVAPTGTSRRDLIRFVTDRPGHDRRYAMDGSKLARELGWTPSHEFVAGLDATIDWYLAHRAWCERVQTGVYRDYLRAQYGERVPG
jgi:dTDP-glucose 4,6-dehydratase